MKGKMLALAAAVTTLSGCAAQNSTLFYKGLQNMVKADSEEIPLDLAAPDAIGVMNQWVVNDLPSAATLTCSPESGPCDEAITLLKAYRVPYTIESITANVDKVILLYDRVTEMPCNAKSYGCSQALNAFSMIDDPRKIVRPNPVDYPSSNRFTRPQAESK